jgi:hypothetical protein
VRNSILAALLASQYERLLPKLEHVTLQGGEIVVSTSASTSDDTSVGAAGIAAG